MNGQKSNMDRVGIITYHAAYNFGSVLQSLATQKAITNLGYDARIIDYRPLSQVNYYSHFFRRNGGAKSFFVDFLSLPNYFMKAKRKTRFETFISRNFLLTDKTYHDPSELNTLNDKFDIFVSGSDQIINKHSNELEHEQWSSMGPYLLDFTSKRKISYASSPASMTGSELKRIQKYLIKFESISAREANSATTLSHLLDKKVRTVLDPTLLFSGYQWDIFTEQQSLLPSKFPHNYILYYTLLGPKQVMAQKRSLNLISHSLDLPVVFICPFVFIPGSDRYINALFAGPAEFVQLVKNAKIVITDSYHGTLFSINLHTPFWSLSNGQGSHSRKDQILQELQLTNHIVKSIDEILYRSDVLPQEIGDSTYLQIDRLKQQSISYLNDALSKPDMNDGR